jgi:hypothetical protein
MGGLPYGLTPLAAAGLLAVRHAGDRRASALSKWAASGVALASALASLAWPIAAALAQLVQDQVAGFANSGWGLHR